MMKGVMIVRVTMCVVFGIVLIGACPSAPKAAPLVFAGEKSAGLYVETPTDKGPEGRQVSRLISFRSTASDFVPVVDISGESFRQTVIAEGTKDRYEGHPTTLLADDGRTMFCVWTTGHGGPCGQMARSDDGGRTWTRLDSRLPAVYGRTHRNCPVLQKLKGADGKVRYFIYSAKAKEGTGLGIMMSEDCGDSWTELPCQPQLSSRMPPTGVMELKNGDIALFGQCFKSCDNAKDRPTDDQAVWMAISKDGGRTYGEMRNVMEAENRNLCEPCCLRSPDGKMLLLIARENRHKGRSMMSFSRDEGRTWAAPVNTPWALTGDRHEGVLLPDGRYVIAFRDQAVGSPTRGQFMAWVGTFDDLANGRNGQYRIHLLNHYGRKGVWPGNEFDTGYPGVELLPDGTIVCTTYTRHFDDDRQSSVVCTRFRIGETDARLFALDGAVRSGEDVRVYPESAFLHAGQGGHLIDVTKAPFFARGDGVHDDTAALKAAMKFAKDNTRVAHAPDGSVVSSPRRDSNWTVYLPRGTYLISDTVSYGWPTTAMAIHYGWRDLRYVRIESEASEARVRELDRTRPKGAPVSFGAEVNWNVRVIGESRKGTVIRLKDGAAGFGIGADKPMISYHLTQRGSNVNYGNVLENLTIDAGRDNPGAVGVKWASSNSGVIRDVTFRAEGASIGVNMPISNACGYMRDLDVNGFRKGFRMCAGAESTMTVERSRVNDADVGFSLEGCNGGADLLNLRKIELTEVKTDIAILGKGARVTVRDCGFHPDTRQTLVSAKDPPEMQWPALADIATPEEFGAYGDGLHDDTAAIQKAFRSGKRAVYFTRAAYAIEGTVDIPETITLVDGMYSGLVRHRTGMESAMFRLVGSMAVPPFEIRRFYMVGAKLLDHVSTRVVYIGDVFVEFPQGREVATIDDCFFPGHFERSDVQWYAYRNAEPSVRKRVFAENCVGLFAQAEPGTTNYLENVDLYARSVNNERGRGGTAAYAMRNCRAWIYGAKSELCRISIDAIDCDVDVSGFNYLNWNPSDFPEAPVIRMCRSKYAIDGFFWKTKSSQPIVLRDIGADGLPHDRMMTEFTERPGENGFEVRLDSRMASKALTQSDKSERCK